MLKELYTLRYAENYYEKQVAYPCTTQIIIAALNEEKGVGLTIAELRDKVDFANILIVDGHSQDRTVEVAKDLGADVVFQDGFGKGDAISKAFKLMKSRANYVVLTDADFTYPAEYVPDMIRILDNEPDVGMVCGNRFNGNVDSEALHSEFFVGNKILALTHSMLNAVNLLDPLTGLRVIRAEIVKNWAANSRGFDIEVELNSLVLKKGYRIVEVPIQYRQRLGEKKLKMIHGVTIFKRMLSEAFF